MIKCINLNLMTSCRQSCHSFKLFIKLHPATYYYFSILCCHFILDCNGQKFWPQSLYSLWEKLLVLAFIWKVTFCQAQSQFLGPVKSKKNCLILILWVFFPWRAWLQKLRKSIFFFQIILFILGYFPFGAVCCYVISLMQVLSKVFCVFNY